MVATTVPQISYVALLFVTYISMTAPLSNPYAMRAIYEAADCAFDSAQKVRPSPPQGVPDCGQLLSGNFGQLLLRAGAGDGAKHWTSSE